MFAINKVQLHVSAISVGHLQVVHEALNDKLYLHVSGGIYILWDGVGARSRFVFLERGVDRVCYRVFVHPRAR